MADTPVEPPIIVQLRTCYEGDRPFDRALRGAAADAIARLTRERDAARAECRVSRELLDENGYPYVNLDETVGPRLREARAANHMEDKNDA